MTYKTIDLFPDLPPLMMVNAHKLVFGDYKPTSGSNTEGWDIQAEFTTSARSASPTFSWTGTEGMNYDFLSFSDIDPSMIIIYDQHGNALAGSEKETLKDASVLNDFVAPYSGTFYMWAGWKQSGATLAGIGIYGDKDSIPAPGIAPYALNGTAGDDALVATTFKENINAGAGFDSVSYSGNRAAVKLLKSGDSLTVSTKSGTDAPDVLTGVEQIKFADKTIDIKYTELTQSLYVSYFGRAADAGGLVSFQDQLAKLNAPTTVNELAAKYNTDQNIRSLIDSFGLSAESKALYSGDSKAFVNAIYTNVLNRAPDQEGLAFWANAIDSGALTRANASLSIMAGAQNNTTAQGLSDKAIVANKVDIASNFTFTLDTPEKAAVYSTASAAATVRDLLASVSPWSNVPNFQKDVDRALVKISTPKSAPDHAGDVPFAQADSPAIELVGLESAGDAPALFF
ncbi:DUF4214 domain-containing protein [Massilia atriviolacea]|uniref:DUF4214 domain-containing protein n=1 Tax=Massilia atriviolacea TaxID=2495579 RepID=A0A430HR73_9BURK|nr:DUF4214 domain-containing protein [Massilia atriviolacea]RSZ59979.1 DUF4214 domain-containing protein [Massilia atriviolacea]